MSLNHTLTRANNPDSQQALDLAKNVYQVHGADASGAVVLRKQVRRGQVLAFLATLPPCTVAMEACGGAHYWAREIAKAGHTVKLIPAAYVKIPWGGGDRAPLKQDGRPDALHGGERGPFS